MNNLQSNYSVKIEKLSQFKRNKLFNELINEVSYMLRLDPNNAQLLRLKLDALIGLDKVTDDVGFLRKLCWYCSLDSECWYYLAKAYFENEDFYPSLIALAYSLSIDESSNVRALLDLVLSKLEMTSLKVYFVKSNRIGHITDPDSWIRQQRYSTIDNNVLHLFIFGDNICNISFFRILERQLECCVNQFFYRIFSTRPLLLSKEFYGVMPYDAMSVKRFQFNLTESLNNVGKIYSSTYKCLSLNNSEVSKSQKIIEKLGVILQEKFVCLHVRDSSFLSADVNTDCFSYHDFRDSKIVNYKSTVEYLLNKGIQVIRIGRSTNQTLDLDDNRYIDLHHFEIDNEELNLLEIYLLSSAQFFIGTASGPLGIAASFDTPCLVANSTPITGGFAKYLKVLPKILEYNNQPVSVSEQLSLSKSSNIKNEGVLVELMDGNELKKLGYEYKNNTPDEILASVKELEYSIKTGDFSTHSAFISKLPSTFLYSGIGHVCNSFIDKHLSLFNIEPL